jgi:transcriptional regulator with XRE-family HTH domain
MDTKKQVAEKIKDRLKEAGINRKQFAGMMSVQPSVVTRRLSGECNFQIFTLFDIERVLDVPLFNYDIPSKETCFIDEFI